MAFDRSRQPTALRRRRACADPTAPDLAAALRACGDVVVITDARRRITWANPAAEALTGFRLAELRGRSPGALLQFERTDPATIAAMRDCLHAGQAFRGVVLNRARGGRAYWLDLNIQPLRDRRGRLTGFVSIQRDVTEAHQREAHLRSIIDGAVAGLLVSDADGLITACNPEAARLLGLPADEIVGSRREAARWELIDGRGQALPPGQDGPALALASGQPVRGQVVGARVGGQRRWFHVSSQAIPGNSEGSTAAVSSFIDVTERRDAALSLATERARLRAALDGTQAGVWEMDPASGDLTVDERWAAITGRTPAEVIPLGRNRVARWMHPLDRATANAQVRAHLRGDQPFLEFSCRLRHAQGQWVWVQVRGLLTTGTADAGAPRLYGTMIDITAAKQAELALHAANAQLQGLFDLSPLGMSLSRMEDGCFLAFNDAMVALLGHGRERLGQLRYRDILAPESREAARRFRETLGTEGRFGPVELGMLRAEGRPVTVQLSAMRVNLADGSPGVWSVMQDLSPAKHLEWRLRQQACTDPLTGLPNRALLLERLHQRVAQAQSCPDRAFALLFLDFDRFKLVNDTLGHEAGDQLLQLIADRLRGSLRRSDAAGESQSLVARLGGDEFVLLLDDVHSAGAAAQVAQRLLDTLTVPFTLLDREIQSTASIGIVLGDADSDDATSLLRNADTAMYEAKRAGRGRYAFFEPAMLASLERCVRLEAALRHAIAQGELSVVYQPIVDLHSGTMVSAEALLRWQHPQLGFVSPAEFIPVAEDSGLIVPIGEWVLWQACREWRRWQEEAPGLAPPTISVNLSRVQMALGEGLLILVTRVLEELAMPPGALQLEVTEREVMREAAAARSLMLKLRALGVKLAMDDFGTGVSSLGCLRDYPFDVIKIDKSFVDELGRSAATLAVLHGAVTVIHNLGMTSVAEGVEDDLQLGALQSLGCRLGQGYLFSRPVAGTALLEALRPLAVTA